MKRLFYHILLVTAAVLLLPSCLVHEFPEGQIDVDVAVTMVFNDQMTPYKTVTKADFWQIRYTLKVFEYSGDAYDRRARYTAVFYKDIDGTLDNTVHLSLPAGKYQIMAWADYTDREGGNYFWNPEEVSDVILAEEYSGHTEYRDAFYGGQIVDYSAYTASGLTAQVEIPMTRPLARYEMIALDKDDFLDKLFKTQGTKVSYDIRDYFVQIDYQYFLPSEFNMRTGKNVNSRTGVSFRCPVLQRENGDVVMAYDFVLATERETRIVANLTLFDPEGINLGTVRGIEVPVVRGGITTVQGKLLTAGTVSGIFIDPSFDGSFDIPL